MYHFGSSEARISKTRMPKSSFGTMFQEVQRIWYAASAFSGKKDNANAKEFYRHNQFVHENDCSKSSIYMIKNLYTKQGIKNG